MKHYKVGSVFLEEFSKNPSSKNTTPNENVYKYAKDRKPIITPILHAKTNHGSHNDSDHDDEPGQQYILIPNKYHILVMSMEHGQTVCKLVPLAEKGKGTKGPTRPKYIQSATILKQSYDDNESTSDNKEEWVLIAGLFDGTMQEWKLSSIPTHTGKGDIKANRSFSLPPAKFNKPTFSHVTSPVGADSGLLYALVKVWNAKGDKFHNDFVRISLPKMKQDYNNNKVQELSLEKNLTILATFQKNSHGNSAVESDLRENTKKIAMKPIPFSLLSVSCERKGTMVNYVVITSSKSLTIYYENNQFNLSNKIDDSFVHVSFEETKSEICSAAVAPNGEDIALGYVDGKIDILVSVLSKSAAFIDDLSSIKTHPKDSLLRRTFHWHSLPVKTLSYLSLPGSRASPNLLSGGEEAVLVTWNVERELNQPTYTLPRIAKGCITHIATNKFPLTSSSSSSSTGMDIVVRCMDNTLQLVQGHNHAVRWKVQGLATPNNEFVDAVYHKRQVPTPVLQIDPRTQTPVITRMAGAPGFIHWFDLNSNQVVGELEVAPYNRISRKEAHHNAYPRPMITNFVMSNSGVDLITVDTMLTENNSMGKGIKVKSFVGGGNDLTTEMSLVTNIKFWNFSRKMEKETSKSQTKAGMPYELISAMPNPHGAAGEIDAIAISPLGSRACSLSYDEGTFHLWGKGKSVNVEKNSLSPLLPSWKRLCKITIPSGYSNSAKEIHHKDGNSRVSFSSDGSVLIIALGRHVTIWDHSNATLLNTIQTQDYLCHVQFVRSPLDMILTIGQSSVAVVAPFGSGYLGNDSWSYNLPADSKINGQKIKVSLVTAIMSRKELAVALQVSKTSQNKAAEGTKIIIVDMVTGKAKTGKDGEIVHWYINAKVSCLCDISQAQTSWASKDAVLLVLTESNEMIILEEPKGPSLSGLERIEKSNFYRIGNKDTSVLSTSNAPTIHTKNKRKSASVQTDLITATQEESVGKGYLLYDSAATSVSTAQLPALSSNFAQSFLSRSLKKFKRN